jgi:hypothetical protein
VIPTTKTDSPSSLLGAISAYSITSGAIPLAVTDSAGAITAIKGTWDSEDGDSEMLIDQQLTFTDSDLGLFQGKVVAVNKTIKRHKTAPYNNPAVTASSIKALTEKVTLDANTFMDGLTGTQRCYPIYHSLGVDTYTVSNAIDHWTQTAGLFYDAVPGVPLAYHSFHGHDYIWHRNIATPGRASNFSANGPDAPYKLVGTRVMQVVDPAYAAIHFDQPGAPWQANTGFSQLGVPAATDANALVFSLGFDMQGSAHAGTWDINLRSATQIITGTWVDLQVTYSTDTGFGLAKREYTVYNTPGSYTSLLAPLGLPVNGTHRVYVSVKEANATQTQITLQVVNTATNTVIDSRSVTVTSALRGRTAGIVGGDISPNNGGTGTMVSVFGWFISLITGALPTAALKTQKLLGATTVANQIIPGFSGGVWDNIKTLLSLHRMDCWYEDNLLKTGLRDTTPRYTPDFHSISTTVRTTNEARNIVVNNYQQVASYMVPQVFFKATTVYQVATAEVQTFTVQTDHSIDRVFNPVCVSGISPYPYTSGAGQYVITGSDGYIVSPAWWAANGGNLTVATTANEGELSITIKGPDYDSVRAPYRVSEGDAGRPALYITGTGLASNKEVLTIPTGNPKAALDVGTTADFKFITNRLLAYNAAAMISLAYAAPDVQFKISEAKINGKSSQLSRKTTGALVKHNGAVYMLTQATQTHSQISGDIAVPYNTIKQINDSFNGATIGTMNTFYNGKSIKDVALKPLNRT